MEQPTTSESDSFQNLLPNDSVGDFDQSEEFFTEHSENEGTEVQLTDAEKNVMEKNGHLRNRLAELRDTMKSLSRQLVDEKEMWKKEIEETVKMTTFMESAENCENAEETEEPEFYEASPQTFNKAEYEEKLQRYHEALIKSQLEKRAAIKKQMAIHNYRRRLLEVENMCNLELMRVKQNVQYLQPLQVMASEWNLEKSEKMNSDDEIRGTCGDDTASLSSKSKLREISEPIESLGHKFCSEMDELVSKMQNYNLNFQQMNPVGMWGLEDQMAGLEGLPLPNNWYNSEAYSMPPNGFKSNI